MLQSRSRRVPVSCGPHYQLPALTAGTALAATQDINIASWQLSSCASVGPTTPLVVQGQQAAQQECDKFCWACRLGRLRRILALDEGDTDGLSDEVKL